MVYLFFVLLEIVGLAPFQLSFYELILFYAHAAFFKEAKFFIIINIIAFVVVH